MAKVQRNALAIGILERNKQAEGTTARLAYRIGHHGRQRFGCMRRLVLIWKTSKCGMQSADRADRQTDRLLITVYWFPVGNGEPAERPDKRCANYCASLILAELKMCRNRRRKWAAWAINDSHCASVCVLCVSISKYKLWELSVETQLCVCVCGKQLVRLSWMKWAFLDETPILQTKKKRRKKIKMLSVAHEILFQYLGYILRESSIYIWYQKLCLHNSYSTL